MAKLLLCSGLLVLSGVACASPGVLVLDASGSMWGQLEGRPKIDIARAAVEQALGSWPPDASLALIAYGHRSRTDCADIETLVPLAAFDRGRLTRAVGALKPNGMTPVGASLRAAAALLPKGVAGTVLLVSDGEETCNIDPCAVAREIERANAKIAVHVVGFDVAEHPARAQLACIAEATGGRYFDARDADGLARAIGAAVFSSAHGTAPAASAAIDWQGPVPSASTIDVAWRGPGDPLDFIAFAQPGSADDRYVGTAFSTRLSAGKPIAVRTPVDPGKYELRYLSPTRRASVLARVAVDVVQSAAHIDAPATAMAGDRIAVRASGPVGKHHWIGIARVGAATGSSLNFVRTHPSGTSNVELMAPGDPGVYEIRYVLNERESIAAMRQIEVVAATARFGELPEFFVAGKKVSIDYDGPRSRSNWIGFVRRGGGSRDYATFRYVPAQGAVAFFAPPRPGDYDLVLVMRVDGKDEIRLRTPVQVR